MPACLTWLAWSLVFAAPPSEDQRSPGWESWKQGQAALQAGDATRAVNLFEESLAADPKLARNYLSLGAAWLDRGDEAKACLYLSLYVAAHPEHAAVRFQYIDLLHRLKRDTEMRLELEELTADLQDLDQPAEDQLLHCHSRLMQLAEAQDNDYEEHLHRGIGLYLLSKQKGLVGDGTITPEGLLCKAAAELTLASRTRPDEARPHFYLHAVWQRLGQSQPAAKNLRAADEIAPFSDLTPAEQQQLRLACHQRDSLEKRR